jgi:sulfate transport system substrate-binding protein
VGQRSGQDYEMVMPHSTIRIDNPVAVVDTYVDEHGTRAAAEAFVDFLFTTEAQAVFAEYGLRAVEPTVAADTAEQYPPVGDLFTIDDFGGWEPVLADIFGPGGVYAQAIAAAQAEAP